MSDGSAYYVCVRVHDQAGNSSAWSCSDGFRLDQSAPSVVKPAALGRANEVDWSRWYRNGDTACPATLLEGLETASGLVATALRSERMQGEQ